MSDVCQAARDLILSFEGCELVVYPDTAGLSTGGIGHRTNLPVGTKLTQDDADGWFDQDLEIAANSVRNACGSVILSDNQFGALCSLVFNIGAGNFRNSTLLKNILAGDLDSVPAQFLRWNRSAGRVSAGLARRREAEAELWSTPDA